MGLRASGRTAFTLERGACGRIPKVVASVRKGFGKYGEAVRTDMVFNEHPFESEMPVEHSGTFDKHLDRFLLFFIGCIFFFFTGLYSC